jgi:hypothetical protein
MSYTAPWVDGGLAYARERKPIFPVDSKTKRPLTKHGFKDATTDENQIRAWGKRWPKAWFAIPTGLPTTFDAADFDNPKWLTLYIRLRREVPQAAVALSPRGGRHVLFAATGLSNSQNGGLDWRGEGGYIVVPPAPGRRWIHPLNGALPEPPDWLLAEVNAQHSSTAGAHVNPSQRYTEAHPCPVCGGWQDLPQGKGQRCWGYIAASGQQALCMREEYNPPGITESGYWHQLGGDCACGEDHGPGVESKFKVTIKRISKAGVVNPAKSRPEAEIPPTLPKDFWDARPELKLIRQAAHSRGRSADAVLGALLTRIAAGVPWELRIPPVVGAQAPLTLYTALIGPPGMGKGSAYGIACELLPLEHVADQLPLGTGEGLVEAFYDWVIEEIESAKGRKERPVKKQVFWNAAFYADEGQVMTAIGQRSGSTLLATLRTAFTGGVLGQTNASQERKRLVRHYTLGLVAAFQDELVGPLLDDAPAGTPQRFLWLSAIDPAIPDRAPDWPDIDFSDRVGRSRLIRRESSQGKAINVNLSLSEYQRIEVPQKVRDEVRRANLQRTRGEVELDLMQAHSDLLRLKVAAVLAVLADRDREGLAITQEDWQLATAIKKTSDGVLAYAQSRVKAVAARKEHETSTRLARREVEKAKALEGHDVEECAKRIREKVQFKPGITRTDARRALPRWRDVFDEGLKHAITEGWVHERSEPGRGADKRALYLGRAKR